MAKTMAVVNNGVVSNIIWCADNTQQTATWLNCDDRPVAIGDTYSGGKFYRDGVEILTPLEEAQKQIAEYEAALSEIETALGVTE